MKCKDCTIDCGYRTSDAEKECKFQNHVIQVPDEWQNVRIQAAIAAMQGIVSAQIPAKEDIEVVARNSVILADALIEELKKKIV